jgi:hypothetical protein
MTDLTRRFLGVFAGLALVALTACNLENIQAPGLAKDKDDAARAVYEAFRKGDVSSIRMGAEMSTPEAQAAIPRIIAITPKGAPTNVRLASWKTNWTALSGPRTEHMETVHEYTYGDKILSVETVMARDIPAQGPPGPWMLRGLHYTPRNADGSMPGGAAAATPGAATAPAVMNSQQPPPAKKDDNDGSFANWEARQDEIGPPPGEEKESGGGGG